MTSVFCQQNSVSLCPASFHTPRPNLPVTSGISSLPTFAFQSSIMKRTFFCVWCQFQRVLQVFIEPFNFSFFGISGWGIDLNDFPWKGTKTILSFLRLHPSTAFWTFLLTTRATPCLLRDSCPHQQIQWSSELNLPIPIHFSSLVPKMSMFTIYVSCLTTSNLS